MNTEPSFDFAIPKRSDEPIHSDLPTESPAKKKRGRPPKPKTPPNGLSATPDSDAFQDALSRITTKINSETNTINNSNTSTITKEEIEKGRVLCRIQRLYDYFPVLVDPKFTPSLSWSQSKLNDEYIRCQDQLKTKDCLPNMMRVDSLINGSLEQGFTLMGVDAKGLLAHSMSTQDLVMNELKELSVKYDTWLGQSVEFRYAMATLSRGMRFISMKSQAVGRGRRQPGRV